MALEFSDSNFEEQVLNSGDTPVLVDFWNMMGKQKLVK
jgi:thioredoxin-like negative regulator of GroEL